MPHTGRIARLPRDLRDLVPVFGPDPRQEEFTSDTESDETLVTNLERGFTAACPNLSFLQWLSHITSFRKGFTRKEAIKSAIADCVQRVESITVKAKDNPDALEVSFVTNDDYGRYRHAFVVDFGVKSYPVPREVKRYLEFKTDKRGKS